MTLHVLTACCRPRNLDKVAQSLIQWGNGDYTWHIRFDWDQIHVGGQALKNELLDEITDGYVMFLDDDTVVHSDLFEHFEKHLEEEPELEALVVSQHHEILGLLRAAPEHVKVGEIDIGQAIIRRDLIGDKRIPLTYAGDGEFLCAILPFVDAMYLDVVLSFHNMLNDPEVLEGYDYKS